MKKKEFLRHEMLNMGSFFFLLGGKDLTYNVDTNKIRDCGNDIIRLSCELNELFSSLFERLVLVPTSTKEWIGESANVFAENVKKDKLQYDRLKEAVYSEGKMLVEYADRIETQVRKMEE